MSQTEQVREGHKLLRFGLRGKEVRAATHKKVVSSFGKRGKSQLQGVIGGERGIEWRDQFLLRDFS